MTIRTNMNNPSYRSPGPAMAAKSAQPVNVAAWRRSFERYCTLAEAEGQDRVARENYYQHAEHYLRLMSEAGAAA
ncbi:DUF4167 domain-containing protein [Parvibaculum sp.]|uniref:DUF4167 domain-containing protein n=1 Tax=Parvibaculum sp. TaxID=2024848 RepID=UPI0032105AE6